MTVPTSTAKSGPYAGAGTTGPFTVGFRFLENSHLQVIRTSTLGLDSTLTLTTDYSVTGAGGASGTVTLVAALAVGEKLTIIRNVPFTQDADYVQNDAFPAESHERALDKLTMEVQQVAEEAGRALTLPATVSGVSTTLPTPQANSVLAWNPAANELQNITTAELATIVAYGTAASDIFTGTGSQVLFVLSSNPGALNNLDVAIGGVTQLPGIDYTWSSGTTVTFTTAPVLGAKVLIRYMQALALGTADAGSVQYTPEGTGAVATTVQTKLRESVSVFDFIPEAQRAAIIAGTSTYNCTDDLFAAAQEIQSRDGGILEIPKGIYNVGKQTFAGSAGLGYAYQPSPMLVIDGCNQPVVIRGNGAVFRVVNGLRFGSFSPTTGLPIVTVPPYYVADSTASIGQVIQITNCRSVTITDLELDGNINNQIIGGEWGDTGRQLSARGILDQENDNVLIENVYSHHHGLDGFETKRTVTSATTTVYPHTYTNCRSTYNGRQGVSWTGGNNLTMISCDLSHTGKNGVVYSAPGAGLDIEPETSLGKNGTFINCRFYDNAGVGMLASTGPSSDCAFYNCQMIGTTNWSGWAQSPAASGYRFHDCKIVGAWVWPGGSTDPELAAKWFGCKFLMDPAASPSGVIYSTRMELDSSTNVLYQGCAFYAASGYLLPFSNAGEAGAIYADCTFEQIGSGTFFTRGNFYGHCRVTHAGTWDVGVSVFFGRVFENGVLRIIEMPTTFILPLRANDGGSGKNVRIVSWYSATAWGAAIGGAIRGDIVLQPDPSASGFVGSVCVTSGNPGTWKTFGAISA